MRVYLPATFAALAQLDAEDRMAVRLGWGFAVTPALEEFYTSGDEEEIAHAAFEDAAEASLRLLADAYAGRFPHRRVVVSVDVPEAQVTAVPDNGESVVRLDPAEITREQVAAIHVDVAESEAATAKAIAVIDESDLGDQDAMLIVGDALDNFLAWYDPSELRFLLELL